MTFCQNLVESCAHLLPSPLLRTSRKPLMTSPDATNEDDGDDGTATEVKKDVPDRG